MSDKTRLEALEAFERIRCRVVGISNAREDEQDTEIVRRALSEPAVPSVPEVVWRKLRKIEQDAPRPFSECACTIRYELDRALAQQEED